MTRPPSVHTEDASSSQPQPVEVSLDNTNSFEQSFPDPLYFCVGVYHPSSQINVACSQRKLETPMMQAHPGERIQSIKEKLREEIPEFIAANQVEKKRKSDTYMSFTDTDIKPDQLNSA